ncbi:MAG: YwbE family protein [Chloroflexi bacterium]|nr:YwbE family protein [Chloroflexota bacterium]
MNGTSRVTIRPGSRVSIVLKEDQRSGKLTTGVVREILTKSPDHPHGIKVRLESGQVGRVKALIDWVVFKPSTAVKPDSTSDVS